MGYRIAKGEKLEDILQDLGEVAEGVRTLKICKLIVEHINARAPLLQTLYNVMFEGMDMARAIRFLMRAPVTADAEYLDL